MRKEKDSTILRVCYTAPWCCMDSSLNRRDHFRSDGASWRGGRELDMTKKENWGAQDSSMLLSSSFYYERSQAGAGSDRSIHLLLIHVTPMPEVHRSPGIHRSRHVRVSCGESGRSDIQTRAIVTRSLSFG